MYFNKLVFMITDQCSAECEMCCFSCSPKGRQVLSADIIHRYIDEAKKIGGFQYVGFTGGEAILQYELLIESIRHACYNGFETVLVTNGFWFEDFDYGFQRLEELKNTGLSTLSLSVDYYHQQFVPAIAIDHAIKAQQILQMPIHLSIGNVAGYQHLAKSLKELGANLYGANVQIHSMLSAGNAKQIDVVDDKTIPVERLRCASERVLFLYCDGTIYPCGSPMIRELPFSLGNANYESISIDIADRIFSEKSAYQKLVSCPISVFESDYKQMTGCSFPEKASSACEICYLLFSNPEIANLLLKTQETIDL